ncbi:hypothetical protein SK128_011775 [Halocaridina rubra]|uniref:DNA-directed RNA polymerase n=1 Tax=Halocaridina rubra TaxID=373956 RepID=A0AAN8XM32_HALRR
MRIKFSHFLHDDVKNLPCFSTLLAKEKKRLGHTCFKCFEEECLGEYSVIDLGDCFVYNTHILATMNKQFKKICKTDQCMCNKKGKCKLKKLEAQQFIFSCNNVPLTGQRVYDILASVTDKKYLFNYLVVPPLHLLTEHMSRFKIKYKNINQLRQKVTNNAQIIAIYHNILYSSKFRELSLKNILNSKEDLVVKNIIGKRSFMTMRAVITSHNYNFDTVYIPACIYETIDATKYNRDYAVLNRQPSLRMESMIAVQIKPVPCRMNECSFPVIKIPIQIVKPLNADFDGDECNLHFPSIGVNVDNMCVDKYIIDSQNKDVLVGPIYEILDFIYYYFTMKCCLINTKYLGYNKFTREFIERWRNVNPTIDPYRCLLSVLSYVVFKENDELNNVNATTEPRLTVTHGIIKHGSIFSKTTLCSGRESLIYAYGKRYGHQAVIDNIYTPLNDLITILLETYPRPSMKYKDLETKDYNVFETFLNSGGKLKKEHIFQATIDMNLENMECPQNVSVGEGVNYFDGINLNDVFTLAPKDRQSLIDSGNSKIAESGYLTKIILKLLDHVLYEVRTKTVMDMDTGTHLMTMKHHPHRSFLLADDIEAKYANVGTLAALCITEYFSQMYLKSANVSNLSYVSEIKNDNFSTLKSIFCHDTRKVHHEHIIYKLNEKQRRRLGEDFFSYYVLFGVTATVEYIKNKLKDIFPNLNPLHCDILVQTLYQNGHLGYAHRIVNLSSFFNNNTPSISEDGHRLLEANRDSCNSVFNEFIKHYPDLYREAYNRIVKKAYY